MSEKFSIDPHSSAFLLVANSQYLIKKVQKHLQKQINLLSQAYLSLTDAKKKKEEYFCVYFLLPMTFCQCNVSLSFHGEVKK